LRDLAINHHETNGLFRQVIGRLKARSGDETQVTFAVLPEAFGEVLCLFGGGHTPDDLGPQFVAGVL
jgi:hypothetical protein